jgi:hypothetical protein
MIQTWQQTLIASQISGNTLTASTAATSILPAAAKCTLPNNFLSIGSTLRIKGVAALSNVVTTPGTLTLDIRFGAVIAFNGGAMQMSTTAHTTLPIWYEILLTCQAIGSGTTAKMMGQGIATSQCLSLTSTADSTTTPATLLMPNTNPAQGTGFDSTTTQQIDHFATFSVSTANTTITLAMFTVESLN